MITYTMIPDEEIYKVLAELYYKKSTSYKNRKRKLIAISVMGLILVAMSLWGTALSREEDYYWLAFFILGVFAIAYGCYMFFFWSKKAGDESHQTEESRGGHLGTDIYFWGGYSGSF